MPIVGSKGGTSSEAGPTVGGGPEPQAASAEVGLGEHERVCWGDPEHRPGRDRRSPSGDRSRAVGVAGLGLGAVNPPASHACLHLTPDQAAAIAGLRVMFINIGLMLSVSMTTAILNRSTTPGITRSENESTTATSHR